MSTSFFQFYSLMQLFLLKAWFPYVRYDCCDHCDRWEKKKVRWLQRSYGNHFPEFAATTIAEIEKILSRDRCHCDCYDRWKVVSLWSLWSLACDHCTFFFSVITVIVAIIWKPGLSYASLLHKIRFNNYKQEGCIMLFTYSCFNCQNEKGLLNFVSERINVVYRINNTRYNFQKNKLPFKHLKPQFMGPILSN